jgi:type I restriction enzyme, R subunit
LPVHTEKTFEEAIEAHLLAQGGWTKGNPADFRRDLGLVPQEFFAFVQDTQPQLWEELRKQNGSGLEEALLDALTKNLESRGTVDVLRHGFKILGKKIEAAYFQPAHGLNPEILAKYQKNRLVLTRQVRFIPEKDDSVDMVFFLNGLPVATVELKNHLTGQNVEHAISQYQRRDPKHRLFHFKRRALVHFAVDPDLACMTTRLAGKETVFLPFNRGCDGGKGNPPSSGYKTAYLWEEVWQRDSFLDILARFVHVVTEETKVDGKTKTTESLIFPRYHQLDVVRRLVAAARTAQEGQNFLVQHSAGSGKSNSIAWLAHRLSNLHAADDQKAFGCVVVVTDRKVLDKQLQDTIYQFEHKQGVVACIDEDSAQLAKELKMGTPIVITTLQKFPFVTEKIGQLPERRYAVIVDEAHSSHTGEAARLMKEVLTAKSLEAAAAEEGGNGEDTWEDRIAQVMASRGRQKNLCFFAFTATPKYKTLEIFGQPGPDGKPVPFHLYSMRQAIEERFILDVLENYITYKRYYRLVKACEEDPHVPERQARSQLARFIEIHPHNLAQKTEVIVEHYRQKVRHKINGRAKAMVVTGSRLHAVRYKQAFDTYLAEKGYGDIGVLVAFSGSVKDPDLPSVEYTEVGMNGGIRERELPDKFDTDGYHVLIAANKYQTGFDQPLLHTMYVDKRLSGVQAVQALSRLNRIHPGKTETFVLDFVNDTEEIRGSFQPYYEQTTVAESAEPQQLYDLQHKLDAAQVYYQSEVEAFAKVFYKPSAKQSMQDQAELYRHLNPAVDRFSALDEEKQDTFRNQLGAFVRLYAFLSQVMPFQDPDLETRYTFCRFLEMKLPRDERRGGLVLDDDVALAYYRLDKISEGTIELQVHEGTGLHGPTEVGSRTAKEQELPLSEIIDVLNSKFGTHFTRADQLGVFDAIRAEAVADEEVVQRAHANEFENFALAFRPKVEGLMLDRMDRNQEIVTRYLNDPEFRGVVDQELARRTYDQIRGTG